MNAEVPGGSTPPEVATTAQPSADAAVSDQDQQDLTAEERFAVEMAMERRAGQESLDRQKAPKRQFEQIDKPLQGVIAGISPLPGNVVSALNIATAEERRCAKRVAENPADQIALEHLRRARVQLERIRVKAGLRSGGLPRHRPRREAFRYARERSLDEAPEVEQETQNRFQAELERFQRGDGS